MALDKRFRNIETITFFIAVIMAVISGICILCCLGAVVYFNVYWNKKIVQFEYEINNIHTHEDFENKIGQTKEIMSTLLINVLCLLGVSLFAGDLTMNVLLCNGIFKMKTGFMKGYLWYGVVKNVLTLIVGIVLVYLELILLGALLMLSVGLYCLVLLLIFKTMQKFKAEQLPPYSYEIQTLNK